MKKQNPIEYEQQLIDWIIKYFDGLPHELKTKLADALSGKLLKVWTDNMFKDFMPEWDKQIDDLRKSGWK